MFKFVAMPFYKESLNNIYSIIKYNRRVVFQYLVH